MAAEYVTLDVTLLLFAAMAGIVLAKRLGQSAIVGEILLGVLIGPTLLGWVSYDEPVKVLAELGAIFMLFTVGLESDMRQLARPRNALVAAAGVVLPFALGWWVSSLFGYGGLEGLFIATSLTATSIAITVRILQERGMLSTPVARTIVGAAVIDDVLGLVVLSVITGLSGSAGWAALAGRVGIALGFVAACFLLVRPVNALVRWVELRVRASSEHAGLFAAMVVAFGYAGIAQIVGLSAIVGAFLAGVTLEESGGKAVREAAHYLETIFSAIFFVSLGVVADFTRLGGAWAFALALIAAALVSKFVGCWTAARACGHTAKEAASVGLGMVPRGEVAMIVALLGLSAGVIGEPVYGAIIVMAFATTVVTPLLLSRSLPPVGAEEGPAASH